MKIVIAGGSGYLGKVLLKHFQAKKYDINILTRDVKKEAPFIVWDGQTLGSWQKVIDGSDVVINLAGRTVDCRPTKKNLREMMDSRIQSTRVIGEAIAQCHNPPNLWIQMSTATIYAHSFDQDNDEYSGTIGGNEPNIPDHWHHSTNIAKNWEKTLFQSNTPNTRRVAVRSALVVGPDKKGYFDTLLSLSRVGLGGAIAGGKQYVSWIHQEDFIQAIDFFISRKDIKGVVNVCSPHPLPQREFMSYIRSTWGVRVNVPITKWILTIGTIFLRTDAQLVLKSRRAVPTKLLSHGFQFKFPRWPEAVIDIVKKYQKENRK